MSPAAKRKPKHVREQYLHVTSTDSDIEFKPTPRGRHQLWCAFGGAVASFDILFRPPGGLRWMTHADSPVTADYAAYLEGNWEVKIDCTVFTSGPTDGLGDLMWHYMALDDASMAYYDED